MFLDRKAERIEWVNMDNENRVGKSLHVIIKGVMFPLMEDLAWFKIIHFILCNYPYKMLLAPTEQGILT